MQSIATKHDTKICSQCCQGLPITEFRRKYKDRPRPVSGECKRCRNRLARLRRLQRKKHDLSKYLTAIHNAEDMERVTGLINTMLAHFGGIAGLATAWKDSCDLCRGSRRMQAFLMRSYFAIFKMIEVSERHGLDQMSNLTDEELAAEVRRGLCELIEEFPQVAVEAAQQLGWQVTPPSGRDCSV